MNDRAPVAVGAAPGLMTRSEVDSRMAGTEDSAALARVEGASLARRLKLNGASLAVVSDKLADDLCRLLGVKDHERRAQLLQGVTAARKSYVAWVQNKWLQAHATDAIKLLKPLAHAIEGGRWSTARKRLARITAPTDYNLLLSARDAARHTAQWLLRSASVGAMDSDELSEPPNPDAPETSEVERMIEADDARAAPIVRAAIAKGLSFKKPAGIGRVPDRDKDHVALMLGKACCRASGKEPVRGNEDDGWSTFQDFVVLVLSGLTPGGEAAVSKDGWAKRWKQARNDEAEIEKALRKLADQRAKFAFIIPGEVVAEEEETVVCEGRSQ